MVFRKGGFLAARDRWFSGDSRLEVVNNDKYLGQTFSTGQSFTAAMEDMSIRAKRSRVDILRALKKIGCNSPVVFFNLFDARIVPTLLYGAEIWGNGKYEQMEGVHPFACKHFFCMSVTRLRMTLCTENWAATHCL